MEFFKGTKEMVAAAHYYRAPFLWNHYCFRQQFGHCTFYLYYLLVGEFFLVFFFGYDYSS